MVPTGGADAVNPQALAVELEPATTDAPEPHYWAAPFALTANLDLGDVHLPAYGQPNTFRFVFHGDATDGQPVAGAIVRARTLLAMDAMGTTDFLRDGLTDETGQASLSLFPGSTAALRLYDIAVVPPADSGYATTCLQMFPLATGGLLTTIVLAPRPSLTGSVVGADGSPAAGVVVQTTRTAGAQATACDAYASTPQMTATTAADGTFSLQVDVGTYTFDFDPPAGTPYPRLTETGVVVAASGASHPVVLPPGAVVEGTLRDATGQPLPQRGRPLLRPRLRRAHGRRGRAARPRGPGARRRRRTLPSRHPDFFAGLAGRIAAPRETPRRPTAVSHRAIVASSDHWRPRAKLGTMSPWPRATRSSARRIRSRPTCSWITRPRLGSCSRPRAAAW